MYARERVWICNTNHLVPRHNTCPFIHRRYYYIRDMYLRVITISDIANIDGKKANLNMIKGISRNNSKYQWPEIPIPQKKQWNTWKNI